jgi:hypothetical protein
MDDPVVLRSLERIISVVIGGLAIYLGYKLFSMVQLSDSEGKFSFKGAEVTLTRVGPGVFFALFGAAVVTLALYKAVTFTETSTNTNAEGSSSVQSSSFGGISNPAIVLDSQARRDTARNEIRNLIAFLNQARPRIVAETPIDRQSDVARNIRRTKLILMGAVWEDNIWGEYNAFQSWVLDRGEAGTPPTGTQSAAEYFKSGE